jgi:beta-galactosidase
MVYGNSLAWSPTPDQRPKDFFKKILITTNWEKFCAFKLGIEWLWYSIYTNVTYPFVKNPPFISHNDNPVGSYKRTFEMP